MADLNTTDAIASAQHLRMQRMMWGFISQACTWLVIIGLYLLEMLTATVVLYYFAAIAVINLGFVAAFKSGVNLRLRDPSLTAAQIIAPVWPAIYVMFHVPDFQARTVFLLMAVGGLLFGTLALSRTRMMMVGLTILASYLTLLVALQILTPERLNWRVESIVVFAYGSILMMVTYIGSYISGMRLKLKHQNRQLAELAASDPLTRLPNRRSLMDQLQHEASRVERRSPEQNDLCISMLDVDHFKHINDSWGHDTGDAVLCRISDALRDTMRQGDFIGRFGGEEFVVILPESTQEAALLTTERIRQHIEALQFKELPAGQKVTVSQGVAIYQAGEKIMDTLKRADEALYQAKASGRNQVVFL